MFPNLATSETQLLIFALVLVRISAFIVTWPIFSVYSVPNQAKVLFAVLLAMLMVPSVTSVPLQEDELANSLILLTAQEATIGACLGFITRMFFFAFSIGGNLIATYMGLSSAQLYNPTLGIQSSTVEQFYLAIATLIFLALNGHHVLIDGLAQSFQIVPLAASSINITAFQQITDLVQQILVIGLQISAPMMMAIFLLNVLMGILGRAVPQINVLITSLPVNIFAGFLVMFISMPVLIPETESLMNNMAENLFRFLRAL